MNTFRIVTLKAGAKSTHEIEEYTIEDALKVLRALKPGHTPIRVDLLAKSGRPVAND